MTEFDRQVGVTREGDRKQRRWEWGPVGPAVLPPHLERDLRRDQIAHVHKPARTLRSMPPQSDQLIWHDQRRHGTVQFGDVCLVRGIGPLGCARGPTSGDVAAEHVVDVGHDASMHRECWSPAGAM